MAQRAGFSETIAGPRWLSVAGASTLAIVVLTTAVSVRVLLLAEDVPVWLFLVFGVEHLVALGAAAVMILRRITISLGDTHLDARLEPLRVMHVRLKDVTCVDVADLSARSSVGIGWRIVGRDQFVLWSAGPAVWLTLADGQRRVIRTDRADELSRTVLEAMTSASPAA